MIILNVCGLEWFFFYRKFCLGFKGEVVIVEKYIYEDVGRYSR